MEKRSMADAASRRSRDLLIHPLLNQFDKYGKLSVPSIDANGTLSGKSDELQRSSPTRKTPRRIASAAERGCHGSPSSVIVPATTRSIPNSVLASRDLPPPRAPQTRRSRHEQRRSRARGYRYRGTISGLGPEAPDSPSNSPFFVRASSATRGRSLFQWHRRNRSEFSDWLPAGHRGR